MIFNVWVFGIALHDNHFTILLNNIEKVVIIIFNHWEWHINYLIEIRIFFRIGAAKSTKVFTIIIIRLFLIFIFNITLFFLVLPDLLIKYFVWKLCPQVKFIVQVSPHDHCTCDTLFYNEIFHFENVIIDHAI